MEQVEKSQFFFMCIDASQHPVVAIMVNGNEMESVNKNFYMQKPRIYDVIDSSILVQKKVLNK